MLGVFCGLKGLIKISHVHIDSTVFRLHYLFTVMFLLGFLLMVMTRQYSGNPITVFILKTYLKTGSIPNAGFTPRIQCLKPRCHKIFLAVPIIVFFLTASS